MPACGRSCSAAEGRMVFLSSRVLSEVERIADRVGIICEGRLVDLLEVSALKTRALRRFELHFARPVPPAAFDRLPGGSWSRSRGDVVRCAVEGSIDALIKAAASHELVSHEPDLEEIFLAYTAGHRRLPGQLAVGVGRGLEAVASADLVLPVTPAATRSATASTSATPRCYWPSRRRWRWSRWSPSSAATWPPEHRPQRRIQS